MHRAVAVALEVLEDLELPKEGEDGEVVVKDGEVVGKDLPKRKERMVDGGEVVGG